MQFKDRYYNPYKIGKRLFKDGYGISDIASAVKCDTDIEEAHRGYIDAQARADLKQIKSQLGYSRIGLRNV
jgi:hypothetical protein